MMGKMLYYFKMKLSYLTLLFSKKNFLKMKLLPIRKV